ncbi:MAG TPA: RNA polymerase sigma factor [Pyrinomonadaceae bacterium]|nr:RNA polymerase sigma factor [Pyrinomonadaceae bacterium]
MTVTQTPTDAELLRLMLAGDEEAFVTLYRRRQGAIYRFALQMSGSEAVADDVTQEVFMVLMRDGRNFDPARGSVAAYLYGIARNHVLRVFDRERSFVPIGEDADDADVHERLVAHDDPLGDLTRGEMLGRLRQAVTALPAHYREVVVLCELHEMSYAEAAGALDCPVGTVRSRLNRARAMLTGKMRGAQPGAAADLTEGEPAGGTLKAARCYA